LISRVVAHFHFVLKKHLTYYHRYCRLVIKLFIYLFIYIYIFYTTSLTYLRNLLERKRKKKKKKKKKTMTELPQISVFQEEEVSFNSFVETVSVQTLFLNH